MEMKQRVAVIFGGQSGEHEVSLMSATSVINNLDRSKYDLFLIGITKAGGWMLFNGDVKDIQDGSWESKAEAVVLAPDPTLGGFFLYDKPSQKYKVDVIFPVLHGPMGEDGTIQGLLELTGIPYVGCGVLASSAGMDKATSKAIFKSLGLPQGEFYTLFREDWERDQENIILHIESKFKYPIFIKPVNMGSSVGISKAHSRDELVVGIKEAGKHDRKILIEEFINCREIECAVLGNHQPETSILGEIVPSNEFYDYKAKYYDGGMSKLMIPAKLSHEQTEEIRSLAVKAYQSLDCAGMSRVDFFVDKNTGSIYINEINTIPGFTQISMYPKLWGASGIPYAELLDQLIELALNAHKQKHHGND